MLTIFSKVKISLKQVIKIFLLISVSALGKMMLPSLLAQMINRGVVKESLSAIYIIAVIMVFVMAFAGIINFLSVRLAAEISTDFSARLRALVFERVQTFSSMEMDKFGAASLITRCTSDVTNVQGFLSMILRMGLLAPMMAVAGLVFSSSSGGKVSSVLVVSIPVLIICVSIVVMLTSRYTIILRKKLDNINRLFLESLEGVRVIRAFNKQKDESRRFAGANNDFTRTSITAGRLSSLTSPVINLVFGGTTAAVLGIGARYVESGEMEVGFLVANTQYISMVLASVMMCAVVITMFPITYACAKRIAEVVKTEPKISDGDYRFEDRPLRSSVEFRDVTFAYPGADRPVLKDLNFEVRPGELVAIVGGTGKGKSSILKLIERMYDPTSGEILVDGVNIKNYALKDLRSLIGYVPQKNILFSGDVASNLNFGKQGGTQEDWERAARISCAEEFITKKPEGYHSKISREGANLSGGQRQRMAIARTVMKNPEIYVFDDSFSALDMQTDRTLRRNLMASIGDSSVIMVTQRISTILDADKILVVDEGTIVGQGKHSELLKTCPLYREIAELQLGEVALL